MLLRMKVGSDVIKVGRRVCVWLMLLLMAFIFPVLNSFGLIVSSYGNNPVPDPGWPAGALALANLPSRVGWWEGPPFGGGEWQFLYRGDAKALSEALTNFATIHAPSLELVIHDGPQTHIFIKDSGDGRVDWAFTIWVPVKWIELYNNPTNNWNSADPNFHKPVAPPKLDVYIGGGQIDWSQVKVPAGIEIRDERGNPPGSTVASGTGNRPVADPGWPAGALAVANLSSRVAWDTPTNEPAKFLYRGDAKAFSEALAKFAAIRAAGHELLLSDGTFHQRDGESADWVFTVWEPARFEQVYSNAIKLHSWASDPDYHPDAPRINLFAGGQVKWSQVKVPAGIHIVDGRSSGLQNVAHSSNPPQLSLSIRCTSSLLMAGDEIPVEFIISNVGTDNYEHLDPAYDRSGRLEECKLVAKTKSGEMIPDPRANKGSLLWGGLSQRSILQPGGSFSKTIPLNCWALVKEPGQYTITGSYTAASDSTNPVVFHSEPITITVLPRTESEMDSYILDLSNKLAAIPPVKLITSTRMPENFRVTNSVSDVAIGPLVMKLMYTCSPKIVPTLLKTMCEPASDGFWESGALLYYVPRSEEIKNAIVATAAEHGLGNNMQYLLNQYGATGEQMKPLIKRSLAPDSPHSWSGGALAAQQFSDASFSSRLVAIAENPDLDVDARDQAILALAANRTDETVAALKSLLENNDRNIRFTVTNAIRGAYFYRGNMTGTPLRPDDFPSLYHKPY